MDKKWNLQDIKPAERKKRSVPPEMRPQREKAPKRTISSENDGTMRIEIGNGHQKKRSSYVLIGSIFGLVVVAIFLISYFTSGAEVTVFPRYREPNVNAEFTAYRTPQVDQLAYEILSLEADGERQVSATGQEEVSEQATGVITIFKTTSGAQRLTKNTRFESPEGRIYRITESVVVPGAVGDSAGSIRADVFADESGEEYNTAKTRFTVPGLEDDPELFKAIYAEVAEPITGGFNGQKFIIDETELATAKQALQMELRDALLSRVPAEKPAGFVVFDEAVTFTYQSLPAVEYGENLATIKEKALLQIPIFKEEDFAGFIAEATVPGFEGEAVRIDNYDALTFDYSSATTSSSDIGNFESVTYKLVGKPLIVWTYDEGKLTTDLVNASKTALPSVLGGYPAIEKAEAVIRPFWQRSFPSSLEDIEIIEVVKEASVE